MFWKSEQLIMSYPQDVDGKNELQFATPWRRFLPVVVGGLGLVLIFAGVLVNLWKQQGGEKAGENFPKVSENQNFVKDVQTVKAIKIDVSGAVVKPGLVETPMNSRVQDVLITAGGFDPKADRTYISRYINLAQPVQDGMKIYIPFEGESPRVEAANEGSQRTYNVNSASQAKLEELPGIGPATAKRVLEGRPYGNIEELVSKKILSKGVFEKIKANITVY